MSIECINELSGWKLHLCSLRAVPGTHEGTMQLARGGTLATFHGRFAGSSPAADPVVRALHERLRADGIDPDRWPPSSQRLAERVLAGADRGPTALADAFCELLVLKTLAPWAVLDGGTIRPPLRFRRGRPGEALDLGDGPLAVAGWPLLVDGDGPLATPLAAGSARPPGDSDDILLVCFQPAAAAQWITPAVHLARFVVMTWAYRFVEERVARVGAAS